MMLYTGYHHSPLGGSACPRMWCLVQGGF
uniref:Uncharacterized protein n=1 Tax=Anguilla anguilla TaxID=7936 RepID=A0A0E9RKC2_ANGAN